MITRGDAVAYLVEKLSHLRDEEAATAREYRVPDHRDGILATERLADIADLHQQAADLCGRLIKEIGDTAGPLFDLLDQADADSAEQDRRIAEDDAKRAVFAPAILSGDACANCGRHFDHGDRRHPAGTFEGGRLWAHKGCTGSPAAEGGAS